VVILVVGWVIWVVAAWFCVSTVPDWFKPVKPPEQAKRSFFVLQDTILGAGLVATAFFPLSKFHLLWILPLAILSPGIAAFLGLQLMMLLTPRRYGRIYGGDPVVKMREDLEAQYGEIWTLPEFQKAFAIVGAWAVVTPAEYVAGQEYVRRIGTAPFSQDDSGWYSTRGKRIVEGLIPRRHERGDGVGMVFVKRRKDGVEGTLLYRDNPRFYFSPSDSIAE